jgi:general L-amino acid transport system permease protein
MSDTHAETDVAKAHLAFVRTEFAETEPAPVDERGPMHWMQRNLFPTVPDAIATVLVLVFLFWFVPPLLDWAFFSAVWDGANREACLGEGAGACWAFVDAKFEQFMYGRYPFDLRWRVDLTAVLLIIGLVPMAIPRVPFKRLNGFYLLVVFPIAAFILLTGQFGLQPVPTSRWGGLMVTLVVAIVGIVFSLPFGVVLALGRRSHMPFVRYASIVFIEFWRGVPLITILFMSSVMLPLFMPDGVDIDKLLRALVGVAFFASAYMAEVIRGGLQAIPNGQYEAADAMGLSFWQKMRLIILPQALKLVIPGIVNTFIGLFKDTSLVLIIGIFDLLGIIQLGFADPDWSAPQTPATGFAFAAFIYFLFCFSMSKYSVYMERRLDTERH